VNQVKRAAPPSTAPRRTALKSKPKYPYLDGCYVDEGFDRTLTREFLQATVNISHYKGAMLLRVLPEPPKKGAKHSCTCPSIQYPSAWLRGDDLDALIGVLREAKRIWLCAYRKAAREIVKRESKALRQRRGKKAGR
jgi:hypothetical protein